MILCVAVPGDALFSDSLNVILKVLSPTTRRNDEVRKFRDYLTIPTLGTYILAETESPFLTLHRRDGAGNDSDLSLAARPVRLMEVRQTTNSALLWNPARQDVGVKRSLVE